MIRFTSKRAKFDQFGVEEFPEVARKFTLADALLYAQLNMRFGAECLITERVVNMKTSLLGAIDHDVFLGDGKEFEAFASVLRLMRNYRYEKLHEQVVGELGQARATMLFSALYEQRFKRTCATLMGLAGDALDSYSDDDVAAAYAMHVEGYGKEAILKLLEPTDPNLLIARNYYTSKPRYA
jgi:hypothetical protein